MRGRMRCCVMSGLSISLPAKPRRRDRARARLLSTSNRLVRLEAMAQDPDAVDRLLRDDRYLRLAGAIALASLQFERARLACAA